MACLILCNLYIVLPTFKYSMHANVFFYYFVRVVCLLISSEGGWMYLYSFICLFAGAVECASSCFATTLLYHVPLQVTSVPVLFVISSGLY